ITWGTSFRSRVLAHGASAWTPSQTLFSCATCTSPHADMNAAGVGALAWMQRDSSTGNSTVYARRYMGGQWEAQSQFFGLNSTTSLNALAVSPTGTIHLLYDALFITFAAPTGAWSTPTRGV